MNSPLFSGYAGKYIIPIQLCLRCLTEAFLMYCMVIPALRACLQFEILGAFCTSAGILLLPSNTKFLSDVLTCQLPK